ncbi:MAG: helix-turn-helix domain-containing protein [Limnospira sp. PMC 1291.21]|uniref:Transcriptional regulator, HxlR family n=3 Tax=Limnospira TaxID=2596745 RepID=A0A9P1KBI2_9CYAN|nr:MULTISPECIES: helix-turn-helix domain-containing protein [Limnospira]MDC0837926.1 helix-turn-helix domain-containing protein [Limnoraphis robusta]MDY7055627.1 helix-turn-helix domain-containing protein [Limnospira fusiformis LS22]RAQ41527.1 transcriptional regulator [Arthrospira sp. O9.13F]UWU51092.1 transcriptional regulator, HxlR family [Arthrospira platensis C1]EDZ95453.1 transcriptional regulator, HxlR family [Limnospira maxima CS-328]
MSTSSENSTETEQPCPIEYILDRINSKWSFLILRELLIDNRRTHQLQEALPISTKTLTIRLRELEKYGMIERKVYPEIPPRVEYSLTPRGRNIKPVIDALQEAGEAWLSDEQVVGGS